MGFPGSVLLNQGDIYKQTSDKRMPLGTRGYTRDGRVFRYARAGGTALAVAVLCQAEAPLAGSQVGHYFRTVASSGDQSFSIRTGSSNSLTSANAYADGYMRVDYGTGAGQQIQIKSHTAAATSATMVTVIAHDGEMLTADAVATADSTACVVGFVKNLYDDVIIHPVTTATSVPLGVTPRNVTAAYYFWLQTWGPATVLCQAALTIGKSAMISTAAGAVVTVTTLAAGITNSRIGTTMQVGAASHYGMVRLNLDP